MENALKGLLFSGGVVVTCLIMALGFFVSKGVAHDIVGSSSDISSEFNRGSNEINIERETTNSSESEDQPIKSIDKLEGYVELESMVNQSEGVIKGSKVAEILQIITYGASSVTNINDREEKIQISANVMTQASNITYILTNNIYTYETQNLSIVTEYLKGSLITNDSSNIAYIQREEDFNFIVYKNSNGVITDISFTQISPYENITYQTGTTTTIIKSDSYNTIANAIGGRNAGTISGKQLKTVLDAISSGAFSYPVVTTYSTNGTNSQSNDVETYIDAIVTTKVNKITYMISEENLIEKSVINKDYSKGNTINNDLSNIEYIDEIQKFNYVVTQNEKEQITNITFTQTDYRDYEIYETGVSYSVVKSGSYDEIENIIGSNITGILAGKQAKIIISAINSGASSYIIENAYDGDGTVLTDSRENIYILAPTTTKLNLTSYNLVDGVYKETSDSLTENITYSYGSSFSGNISDAAYIDTAQSFTYTVTKNTFDQITEISFNQINYRNSTTYEPANLKSLYTTDKYDTINNLSEISLLTGSQVKVILNAISLGAYSYIETKDYYTNGTSSTSNGANIYISASVTTQLNLTTYSVIYNEYIGSNNNSSTTKTYNVGSIMNTDISSNEYIDSNQTFACITTRNSQNQITGITLVQNTNRLYTVYKAGTTKNINTIGNYDLLNGIFSGSSTGTYTGIQVRMILETVGKGAYSYIVNKNYYADGTSSTSNEGSVYVASPVVTKLALTTYLVINNEYKSQLNNLTGNKTYQQGSVITTDIVNSDYIDNSQNFTYSVSRNSSGQITSITFVQLAYRAHINYLPGVVTSVSNAGTYNSIIGIVGSGTTGTLTGAQTANLVQAVNSGAYSYVISKTYDTNGNYTISNSTSLYVSSTVTTKVNKNNVSSTAVKTYNNGSSLIVDIKDVAYIDLGQTFTYTVTKNSYHQIVSVILTQVQERVIDHKHSSECYDGEAHAHTGNENINYPNGCYTSLLPKHIHSTVCYNQTICKGTIYGQWAYWGGWGGFNADSSILQWGGHCNICDYPYGLFVSKNMNGEKCTRTSSVLICTISTTYQVYGIGCEKTEGYYYNGNTQVSPTCGFE